MGPILGNRKSRTRNTVAREDPPKTHKGGPWGRVPLDRTHFEEDGVGIALPNNPRWNCGPLATECRERKLGSVRQHFPTTFTATRGRAVC
jgi:hypothetical protein